MDPYNVGVPWDWRVTEPAPSQYSVERPPNYTPKGISMDHPTTEAMATPAPMTPSVAQQAHNAGAVGVTEYESPESVWSGPDGVEIEGIDVAERVTVIEDSMVDLHRIVEDLGGRLDRLTGVTIDMPGKATVTALEELLQDLRRRIIRLENPEDPAAALEAAGL